MRRLCIRSHALYMADGVHAKDMPAMAENEEECGRSNSDEFMSFGVFRCPTESDGETLVATLRGPNCAGVTGEFLDAVGRARVPVRILDTASYDIEGYLVLSIVIQFAGTSAVRMMQTLLETSRRLGMQLDFQFPATANPAALKAAEAAEDTHQQMLSITIAASSALPVGLLHEIFKCMADHEAMILEVDQRVENKITWNNEYSVFQLHVSLPWEVTIAKLYLALREICSGSRYDADVAVREFSAMYFPRTKSLIVFGLSDVLCVGNILDEILKEAGLETQTASKIPRHRSQRSQEAIATAKVKTLKGKSASCQDRVIAQLKITPGARFVCRVLKDTGFRLAVITNSAGLAVTQAVKEELGLDYAIAPTFGVDDQGNFTGSYAGDTGDLEMRKFDFLQLLADKENIDPRDVIVVGRFMDGLEQQIVHEILNSYGPQLYFHARKAKSLVVVLYLLGFTGKDIRDLQTHCDARIQEDADALRPRHDDFLRQTSGLTEVDDGCGSTIECPMADSLRRCLVRVYSRVNDTHAIAKLFEPLLPYQQAGALQVLSLQQVNLAAGDTVIGFELMVKDADPDAPLKDLLFYSRKLRMDMDWDMEVPEALPPEPSSPSDVSPSVHRVRYVITLMQKPELSVACLASLMKECRDVAVQILRLDRLSGPTEFCAVRIMCLVPHGVESQLRNKLFAITHEHEVDIAFQLSGVDRWGKRLVVFDMDGTLIQQVAWDELAKNAGAEREMKEIEKGVERKEVSFEQALRLKAALLKGQNATRLTEKVNKNLVYTPGAQRLCWILKRLGYTLAVISSDVMQVARQVQRYLDLDYVFANTLEVESTTGELTGQLVGPSVTPQRKRALLSMITEVEGCSLSQTVAVGDGVGDIPMISAAGLGIAFCGKRQAREAADVDLNNKDLTSVLFLLGLSEAVAQHLHDWQGLQVPEEQQQQQQHKDSADFFPEDPTSDGESSSRKIVRRRRSWLLGGQERPSLQQSTILSKHSHGIPSLKS